MQIIFCVEDDDSIRELIAYALKSGGFAVRGFADGESFFTALREEQPHLVLLDIMLPGDNGLMVLRRLRDESPYGGHPCDPPHGQGNGV